MNRRRFPHRPSRTAGGFRSKLEETIAADLQAKGAGAVYEGHRLSYSPAPRVYIPDFTLPNGIHIEAKGYFLSSDRSKMLLVRDQTKADIRLVFSRPNNRLSKSSKTTYAQWAVKHGFPWAEGTVPASWIKEPPRA